MPVNRTAARYRRPKRRPILGLGIRDSWRDYLAGMATEIAYALLLLLTGFAAANLIVAVVR